MATDAQRIARAAKIVAGEVDVTDIAPGDPEYLTYIKLRDGSIITLMFDSPMDAER